MEETKNLEKTNISENKFQQKETKIRRKSIINQSYNFVESKIKD